MEPTPDTPPAESVRRRFRWRIIPAALVGTFGGIYLLGGASMIVVMAYTTWTGRPLYTPGPSGFDRVGFVMSLFLICLGGCLLAASRFLWKGRWLLALAFVGNCIAAATVLRLTGWIPD